jgi:hypothetical protein
MCSRFLFFLLFASACAAQQPAVSDHDMSKMQHAHTHDGFMQGGMHHAVAQGVTLDAKSDQSSHIITLRVGPMNLPANTSHMKMPQPPDLTWTIPMTGWLLAYHAKLVDAAGNSVPGVVLHHVAFWNENRSDFLCPNKEEHIFGAGGELTDWTQIPGFGYRVEKGDQIRVETMIHNPTATSYEKAFLEISIPYLDDAAPAPVKNFYPAWMDVASCGNSSYDLPAGPSKKVGSVPVKYSGILLGVGGHMHDYAQQLTLEVSGVARSEVKVPEAETSRTGFALANKQVAVLPAKVDDQGHLLNIPVVTFFQTGGYPIAAGNKLTVTATYNNPTGKLLRDGAMGIVVGYFVPQDLAALNSLRHSSPSSPQAHHSPSDEH